jgi:polyisoprenoid-binding protein YceI
MLGDDNLQADRFPFVRIHSVHVAGELPKLAVEVQVELHGQQHNMLIPLNVEVLPSRITASGSFVLRQSDFGIQPYSALGGFLAVQNELVIEFTLVGS